MEEGGWRGSRGMARGRGPRWAGPWEGCGWLLALHAAVEGAVSSTEEGSRVTLSLLGAFVVLQPLLRCLLLEEDVQECHVPQGCAEVPSLEEGSWEGTVFLRGDNPSAQSPFPSPFTPLLPKSAPPSPLCCRFWSSR